MWRAGGPPAGPRRLGVGHSDATFYKTFVADNRPEDTEAHLARSHSDTEQRREIEDPNCITLLAESDGEAIAFGADPS